jgi:hypothetical protein
VIIAAAAAVLWLALGGVADSGDQGGRHAQVTVRQRLIIRVPPDAPRVSSSSPLFTRWREGNGPRCIPMRSVAGATLLGENSVALDFYRGFYVNGTADGMICADRDSIRSRMGGECEIDRFRSLRAVSR